MTDRVTPLILKGMATNEEFCRKVAPFIKDEYFDNPAEKILYNKIAAIFDKYNKLPTKEALLVGIGDDKEINERLYPVVKELIEDISKPDVDDQWLIDQTEKWCKDRALYNAITKSIEILDGGDKKHLPDAIPSIIQEALAVGFDTHVGHDYFGEIGARWDFYHDVEQRIPFKLKSLNKVTKGGVPRKTLNVFMAGTNVGKSLFMCDWAAWLVQQGYKVLYVTAEMAEMRIGERLDANILDVSLDDIEGLSREVFVSRLERVAERSKGKLFVKEYPTSSAHAGHIHALLGELKIKQNFVPDIIFVDYLNILLSQRVKDRGNTYILVKAIAEELRGLASVHNVPIISATQTTRTGQTDTDLDVSDTSESMGLPNTVDFLMAIMETEELEKLNQWLLKQLKSRYGNKATHRRFVVGVDKGKQKLYELEESAQTVGLGVVKDVEASKSAQAIQEKFFKKPDANSGSSYSSTDRFKRAIGPKALS